MFGMATSVKSALTRLMATVDCLIHFEATVNGPRLMVVGSLLSTQRFSLAIIFAGRLSGTF